jgi:DNA-binding NtrC family response regulator
MRLQQIPLQSENGSPFWEIKVLLVETNCAIIRTVEKVFEKNASSYFLRRIQNKDDLTFELMYNKPDVIISGRNMGDFTGEEVLSLVDLHSPNLPVLMLVTDFNAKANISLVNKGAYDIIYHNEIARLPLEVNFLFQAGVLKQA